MFYRWRSMGEEDRGRVWRLYGWFSGLMLCGCCFGAVAYGAEMQVLILDLSFHSPSYALTLPDAQYHSLDAQLQHWIDLKYSFAKIQIKNELKNI